MAAGISSSSSSGPAAAAMPVTNGTHQNDVQPVVEIIHLDTDGLGDAIIVRIRGHGVVLIDGGKSHTSKRIQDYLTSRTDDTTVLRCVISHFDQDHYLGLEQWLTTYGPQLTSTAPDHSMQLAVAASSSSSAAAASSSSAPPSGSVDGRDITPSDPVPATSAESLSAPSAAVIVITPVKAHVLTAVRLDSVAENDVALVELNDTAKARRTNEAGALAYWRSTVPGTFALKTRKANLEFQNPCTFTVGNVTFTIQNGSNPLDCDARVTNAQSLQWLIRVGNVDYYTGGDSENGPLNAHVVKLDHHGAGGKCNQMLHAVTPGSIGIISGPGKRDGHPNVQTLSYAREIMNLQLYTTCKHFTSTLDDEVLGGRHANGPGDNIVTIHSNDVITVSYCNATGLVGTSYLNRTDCPLVPVDDWSLATHLRSLTTSQSNYLLPEGRGQRIRSAAATSYNNYAVDEFEDDFSDSDDEGDEGDDIHERKTQRRKTNHHSLASGAASSSSASAAASSMIPLRSTRQSSRATLASAPSFPPTHAAASSSSLSAATAGGARTRRSRQSSRTPAHASISSLATSHSSASLAASALLGAPQLKGSVSSGPTLNRAAASTSSVTRPPLDLTGTVINNSALPSIPPIFSLPFASSGLPLLSNNGMVGFPYGYDPHTAMFPSLSSSAAAGLPYYPLQFAMPLFNFPLINSNGPSSIPPMGHGPMNYASHAVLPLVVPTSIPAAAAAYSSSPSAPSFTTPLFQPPITSTDSANSNAATPLSSVVPASKKARTELDAAPASYNGPNPAVIQPMPTSSTPAAVSPNGTKGKKREREEEE